MAARKIEDRLEELRQLRTAQPDDALVLSTLRKALDDRSNLIVAEAAKVAGALRLASLIPDLLHALDRLYNDPVKTDPKCWGKNAIARALAALDYSESAPFIRGAGHIQMEPVYGGLEDAAIHLRAECVLALVQCRDLTRTEMFRHLIDALSDIADPVRIEAVRAIAQLNGDDGTLLLRLKAHLGDRRPVVIGQVFDSLLGLEREIAVAFVGRFLQSKDPEICDEAALALGASRLSGAVTLLIETWNVTRRGEFSSVLLRALSSSREQSALDFLLKLVREGTGTESAAALEALQLHRDSAEIMNLVQRAKQDRVQ